MSKHYANDDVRAAVKAIGRVALGSDENGPLPQDIATAVLDAVAPSIAARVLRVTADKWSQGQWADAPRRYDRIQERIANAQHVADWLRAHADQIELGGDS